VVSAGSLSQRELNRATLARQLLLERGPLTVLDAVRRVVALQAQEPASPYLALWNRIAGFDPTDLDAAFADGTIRKSSLLRITLHAVSADDHPVFHAAMLPALRASRLGDRRFAETGLTVEDADELAAVVVAFADRPRTRDEVEAHLAERLGAPPHPHVWWALRTFAPLVHAPTGGPWSFGARPVLRAAPAPPAPVDPEAAVQHLVRRYLAGFGPARVQDIGQFTMLRMSTLKPALAALGDELVTFAGPDGRTLLDVRDGPIPDEGVPAPPRLLPMWDSALLAYADRSRVLPDAHRPAVIRRNGDVLPTVLVDGHVRGVWRPVEDGIEVTAFEPMSDDAWDGLAVEARELTAFLAVREPQVYRRYVNWWATLPAVDVRVLPV
jgi:hypothetical protein